jgi:predicted SPOUT superfamily RNA methylase MTH1
MSETPNIPIPPYMRKTPFRKREQKYISRRLGAMPQLVI